MPHPDALPPPFGPPPYDATIAPSPPSSDPAPHHAMPPPYDPAASGPGEDWSLLRGATGAIGASILAVLGWSLLWPATNAQATADVVGGILAGCIGAATGWLAADRGRRPGRAALVLALGAGLPAAVAMVALTRRVDPALTVGPRTTWPLAPLVFLVLGAHVAARRRPPRDVLPADAWLAAVVAAVVVTGASFGILNTVGRPVTGAEFLCDRYDRWAEVRRTTVGGDSEMLARQEFFDTAMGVVPRPELAEQTERLLSMSTRIDANMSPGGDPSQLEASERALKAEMDDWRGRAC